MDLINSMGPPNLNPFYMKMWQAEELLVMSFSIVNTDFDTCLRIWAERVKTNLHSPTIYPSTFFPPNLAQYIEIQAFPRLAFFFFFNLAFCLEFILFHIFSLIYLILLWAISMSNFSWMFLGNVNLLPFFFFFFYFFWPCPRYVEVSWLGIYSAP